MLRESLFLEESMRNQLEFGAPLRCLAFLVLLPWAAYAQPAAPSRPRIGIAFEGGGALGLAHIGVLQWLEEHKIPVDYIAGVSMGGLVGGIYATGHSPVEVKAMVRSINWDQVLQGNTPYKD